jgi:tRNA(Arg) A34 adenosine deaminase TadA
MSDVDDLEAEVTRLETGNRQLVKRVAELEHERRAVLRVVLPGTTEVTEAMVERAAKAFARKRNPKHDTLSHSETLAIRAALIAALNTDTEAP